jgi:hypothetical protein
VPHFDQHLNAKLRCSQEVADVCQYAYRRDIVATRIFNLWIVLDKNQDFAIFPMGSFGRRKRSRPAYRYCGSDTGENNASAKRYRRYHLCISFVGHMMLLSFACPASWRSSCRFVCKVAADWRPMHCRCKQA